MTDQHQNYANAMGTSGQSTPYTKRHRRNSSLWVPSGAPFTNAIRSNIVAPLEPLRHRFGRQHSAASEREIMPNWLDSEIPRYKLPNYHKYCDNKIRTTKYTFWTFVPKNLWEQFHRWANLYFLMIVGLNFIPQLQAFNAYMGIIPVAIILALNAIKDGIEDYRRKRADNRINRNTVHVWDPQTGRFRKMHWELVLVGDLIHVSIDETIPADIVLVRSSDPQGTVFVETSNLDGENNLKQRSVLEHCRKYCRTRTPLEPCEFDVKVFVNTPDKRINYVHGSMIYNTTGGTDLINRENVILRGCQVRNTTFVEGIVLYTGKETKAMLNNGFVRYKRSTLERATNKFIIYCVFILLLMCITGGAGSITWLIHYEAHDKTENIPFMVTYAASAVKEGFINFASFIISYQVLIPLALYISVEVIKLGQIYLINQDLDLYYEETDRRIECRSLNIPEELGQIQYVLSDKTGTLTENKMIFRSCAVSGIDYEADPSAAPSTDCSEQEVKLNETLLHLLHQLDSNALDDTNTDSNALFYFFLNISICNTVMAHRKPHEDAIEHGYVEDEVFYVGNSAFHIRSEQYDRPGSSTELPTPMTPTPMTPPATFLQPPATPTAITFSELPTPSTPPSMPSTPCETKDPPTAINTPTASKQYSFNASDLVRRISSLGKLKFLKRDNGKAKRIHKPKTKERIYEAESPDELCLVFAAKAYGFSLQNRCPESVTVEIPNKNSLSGAISLQVPVMKILPFDSDRKRMSIIVEFGDRILLLCKGADDEVISNLSQEFKKSPRGDFVIENSRQILQKYANDGMRTLVMAMRFIPQDEYETWLENHERIEATCIDDKDEQISQSARLIEKDMELLGVTAIEDRLQDGVAETIRALREAGIQVWVLTGDKLETAKNIAMSCQLFSPQAKELLIDEQSDIDMLLSQGEVFNALLSGKAVKLLKEGDRGMLEVVRRSAAILCYRMTPAEKADVVKTVKKHLKGKVLAVGDGANDVPMILSADVGIGISGQEGLQAVMSSDFALARFKFLRKLLLVHGHWCYYRLANIMFYFLLRNAVLVFIIYWAQIFNGFSGTDPLDPLYCMLYPIIFTSVQPIVYGACDQDVSAKTLLEEPRLYNKGRLGTVYKKRIFAANMIDAVWQSLVIYFIAHLAYFDTECDFWTFGFLLCSSLFFVNSFHLALLTRSWTVPVLCVNVFFCFFHFGFFIFYNLIATPGIGTKDIPLNIAVTAMSSKYFWAVLFVTVVVALTPRFVIKLIQNKINPGLVYEEALRRKSRSISINGSVNGVSFPCSRFVL
uniref:Phospholipid-transporting ATPase n=1 Tax=Acrobeloides nanus TaxID=290746 RepID=A0A914BYV9_9BILA